MAPFKKPHAYLIAALTALIALQLLSYPLTGDSLRRIETQAGETSVNNRIVLEANRPDLFKRYNTNGTPPSMSGNSAVFFGSDKTNMYSDVVALNGIRVEKSLVLQATVTTKIEGLSNTGEDQFAVFAADDTITYKGDEFGFVLPETGSTWYAYVQSPDIWGFFAWKPVLKLESNCTETHDLKAIYSDDGLLRLADFYVDGKLVWRTTFPDVSGGNFYMVLTSHKVSPETVDISQNQMEVQNAVLSADQNSSL